MIWPILKNFHLIWGCVLFAEFFRGKFWIHFELKFKSWILAEISNPLSKTHRYFGFHFPVSVLFFYLSLIYCLFIGYLFEFIFCLFSENIKKSYFIVEYEISQNCIFGVRDKSESPPRPRRRPRVNYVAPSSDVDSSCPTAYKLHGKPGISGRYLYSFGPFQIVTGIRVWSIFYVLESGPVRFSLVF